MIMDTNVTAPNKRVTIGVLESLLHNGLLSAGRITDKILGEPGGVRSKGNMKRQSRKREVKKELDRN
jgi:hypothetical protein